jgi:hypothetical protein
MTLGSVACDAGPIVNNRTLMTELWLWQKLSQIVYLCIQIVVTKDIGTFITSSLKMFKTLNSRILIRQVVLKKSPSFGMSKCYGQEYFEICKCWFFCYGIEESLWISYKVHASKAQNLFCVIFLVDWPIKFHLSPILWG